MFQLVSEFEPRGDQPETIDQLSSWIQNGERYRTLLGATGTGKTLRWRMSLQKQTSRH